ncbi:DUF7344 domain-containing protein [Halococcus salsus]|uniref:DUF7344 domain-containing protein n=1 Tax=Halococcus salsus TaxID=2162894 RepID=UPI00135B2D84|nr:hypothetical protein [Halococcus salsus]
MTERFPSPSRGPAETVTSMPATPSGSADARQRHALAYLSHFEYPVELRTLAAYVAADEGNVPVEAVDDRVREETAIALHHIDLPHLIAVGVVEYDPESRMVVATENAPVGRYVDVTEGPRSFDAV